jgi:ATP-dependent Zn protease
MPRVNDRKRVAYHEAGHVVVAWYYNIPTLGLSIVKGRHSLGESRLLSHFRRLPYWFEALRRRICLGKQG